MAAALMTLAYDHMGRRQVGDPLHLPLTGCPITVDSQGPFQQIRL